MDLFEWSIPFLAEKITEIMCYLIKPGMRLTEKDIIPLMLIDKREILEKFLTHQKALTMENS